MIIALSRREASEWGHGRKKEPEMGEGGLGVDGPASTQ